MASKAQNNNVGGASMSDPALSWQTWKAREGNAEGMSINLVKTGAAVQGKTRVNVREGQLQKKGSITTINSDIETSEIVKVSKKKHTIGQHVGEAKMWGGEKRAKERARGRGRGEGRKQEVRTWRWEGLSLSLLHYPHVHPQSFLTETLMAVGHQI